jgi:thiol:disulfide interchange protein DsbC
MLQKLILIIIALGLVNATAVAAGTPDVRKLQAALGGTKPESVNPTPMPGLYEVVVDGQLFYLSGDGRFVIQGDVLDLTTNQNITEQRRSDMRVKAVAAVGKENMVVFSPDKPAKHAITVFTDIDCGYCRKLHREIAAYNDQGIEVRYLMFPRAGIPSESYDKAVSVWCADDRNDALTRAKQGESIAKKSCPNPVKEQYELGQALGVRGTPSIILDNGQMLPGYVPADRLTHILDGERSG